MFRFTIRELVCLTTIVAVSLCWWFDHRRLAAQTRLYKEVAVRAALERDKAWGHVERNHDSLQMLIDQLHHGPTDTSDQSEMP